MWFRMNINTVASYSHKHTINRCKNEKLRTVSKFPFSLILFLLNTSKPFSFAIIVYEDSKQKCVRVHRRAGTLVKHLFFRLHTCIWHLLRWKKNNSRVRTVLLDMFVKAPFFLWLKYLSNDIFCLIADWESTGVICGTAITPVSLIVQQCATALCGIMQTQNTHTHKHRQVKLCACMDSKWYIVHKMCVIHSWLYFSFSLYRFVTADHLIRIFASAPSHFIDSRDTSKKHQKML